ncbi:Ribonuclease H-like domain containing protein [Parasponia andersonii]|uniref:Ribonuclease H-like domain containing protein n=1 Tax=Parasponia andersonii TaxID=3476 RepID=A0A2P5CU02_PARAD|nr:Ribonuclease H-like domain containing protein [Parasponia andersonii]
MVNDIRKECNTIDWHKRLRNMPCSEIHRLMELGHLPEVDISNDKDCEDCKKPVKYKRPLATRYEKAEACLECIHVHICEPIEVVSYNKYILFITFVDEYSDFGQVYFLKRYDEVPDAFHEFDRKVRMQQDTKVNKFKIEAKHEDVDSLRDPLRPTLAILGISYEYATIYEHSRIRATERYNIRLKQTIELMYKESLLSYRYWNYALRTASYIFNFIPLDRVTSTPFQMWMGYVESLEHLMIWGCEVYACKKVGDEVVKNSKKYFLLGYPKEEKAYILYRQYTNTTFISKSGDFLENEREVRQENDEERAYDLHCFS